MFVWPSLARLRNGFIVPFVFLALMVIFNHLSIIKAVLIGAFGIVGLLALMVVGQLISIQLEKRGWL